MINTSNAIINGVVIHRCTKEENNIVWDYSSQAIVLEEGEESETLLEHITAMYREPLFHQLGTLGPVFTASQKVFESPDLLFEESIQLSRKVGHNLTEDINGEAYFLQVHISDILVDDELLDAMALIVMYTAPRFYKIQKKDSCFTIPTDKGYIIAKPDKACLILPGDESNGGRVLVYESGGVKEEGFWYKDYLQLSPLGNEYSYTTDYIKMTSQFLKQRKPLEQVLDKKAGAEILERSLDYFTQNDKFEEREYKQEVFRDNTVIEAFDEYKQKWAEKNQRPLADSFEPSSEALNKQSKVFRSVIKLDKNFHIYVHGDSSKIMKGEDELGKKYYILYYNEES
ncbi:MAG: nucleoid-associated protein [Saprospiraceae bacterium]|nr:nucleoid-associated protein [Saprospiraceae bacterium]